MIKLMQIKIFFLCVILMGLFQIIIYLYGIFQQQSITMKQKQKSSKLSSNKNRAKDK